MDEEFEEGGWNRHKTEEEVRFSEIVLKLSC